MEPLITGIRVLMKIFALLAMVLSAGRTEAMCVATTRTLVKMGVWQCQDATIGQNLASPYPPASGGLVKGALVTGMVLESRSVLETPESPPEPLFRGPSIPIDSRATVFIRESARSVCKSLSTERPAWFVSTRMCCDTLPASGNCLVPDSIPVVEITRPEGWHEHIASAVQ